MQGGHRLTDEHGQSSHVAGGKDRVVAHPGGPHLGKKHLGRPKLVCIASPIRRVPLLPPVIHLGLDSGLASRQTTGHQVSVYSCRCRFRHSGADELQHVRVEVDVDVRLVVQMGHCYRESAAFEVRIHPHLSVAIEPLRREDITLALRFGPLLFGLVLGTKVFENLGSFFFPYEFDDAGNESRPLAKSGRPGDVTLH